MKQINLGNAEQAGKRKQTRKEVFLAKMDQVAPSNSLFDPIAMVYPTAVLGRRRR